MFFPRAFSAFLFLQLGRDGAARSQASITCLTRAECDKQSKYLGFDSLNVGKYPAKGCFSKGGKAYFGLGGTSSDKAESPLSGNKKRIWCNANASPSKPTNSNDSFALSPNKPPTPSLVPASQLEIACLTRRECDLKQQELGFTEFSTGNYPTKGCFSKGGTAYFGVGGTVGQKSESNLPGQQERIWCVDTPSISTAGAADAIGYTCDDDVDIQVQFKTEAFGRENGFQLSTKPNDGSAPEKLLDIPVKSLESNTAYVKPVCVSEGTYTLAVFGKGSYSVSIDGEEVLFGINNRWAQKSHIILAGFNPPMSKVETEWLDLHNTRREAYHKEHGTEYRPLKWSPSLAKDASDWVDGIDPTKCKVVRKPTEDGENISVKKYRGPHNNELPANIITRWSDFKLDRDYPDNQTMTQVMWRSTRYIGCSNKAVSNDDGTYCYISICRYSRPGNCAVGQYENWLAATLDSHSRCGSACVREGCH